MNNYNQLKEVLNDIFELDKADLDFGIYRIINQKRKQVNEFIEVHLPEDIKNALNETQSSDKTEIENEIKILKKNLEDAGIVAEDSPKYKTLKERLAGIENSDVLEQEVFSHLANFFRRYYKDGDFISMRRYKKDVYAIPYEGEEVKLYWANHDQYYIKSSEDFKNYSFIIPDGKKVTFQLKEVSTEQNNNKLQGDSERRFAIYDELPVEEIEGELVINFIYEPYSKTTKQESLLSDALEILTDKVPKLYTKVFTLSPTEKNTKRTILEKHLNDYISKNSFDYFIHKDLGGFLSRELDFYIKNEVLYLDDINTNQSEFFLAQLSKLKAIKIVAVKVINFLAQIENFQKKLWLKKKMIIETNYLIPISLINDEYYEEILINDNLKKFWKNYSPNLKNIDEKLINFEFLKFNENLVVDTRYFQNEWKEKIISNIINIDQNIIGELIHSDNFQGLNTLTELYSGQIKCIYIDPPFNLGQNGDFLYKTNFKDSSWLSLLFDRIEIAKKLLTEDGFILLRCDNNGNSIAKLMLDNIFSIENFRNEIILNRFQKASDGITSTTESLFLYSKNVDSKLYSELKLRSCIFCKTEIEPQWQWSHSAGEGKNPRYFTIEGKKTLLYPPKGRHWTNKQEVIDELESKGRIRIVNKKYKDTNGDTIPYIPEKLQASEVEIDNNWTDISGYEFGVFTKEKFATQNSIVLLERIIKLCTKENDIVLDFFAGSATTQAAAQKLNRRWLGIEMGEYFYNIPLKRMNLLLSEKNTNKIIKYVTLESYEDTLNNLFLQTKTELDFSGKAKEEYLLQYMLEMESSENLFNLEMFRKPFNYQLKVTENNELKPTKVDLVETFNYLIGLYVNKVQRVKDIKVVEGVTRTGVKTLVIWRDLETTTHDEVEKLLRRFYDSQRTKEFQQIYINGDHHLENLRSEGDSFKIKLIEETFFKKMFNETEL